MQPIEEKYRIVTEIPSPLFSPIQRVSSLDVLKCLAAFAVVCLHCVVPSGGSEETLGALCRWAVPVFFLITGWFYHSISQTGRWNGYLKKLVVLTLVAALVYQVRTFLYCFVTHDWTDVVQMGESLRWLDFIQFNEAVNPKARHLWYFYALLYALLMLRWLDLHGYRKLIFTAIPVLLAGNMLLSHSGSVHYYRNFLFTAFPYLALGFFLRTKATQLHHIKFWMLGLAATLGIALVVWEQHTFGLLDHYYGLPLLATALFLGFIRCPQMGEHTCWATNGKAYSAYIFIFHPLVMGVAKVFRLSGTSFSAVLGGAGSTLLFALIIWGGTFLAVWIVKRLLNIFTCRLIPQKTNK